MKRLLSLLTLTALLATTACSSGEGSAVLSDTAGTSAPTAAATSAATSPEEPSEPVPEPEPKPDYPTVNYACSRLNITCGNTYLEESFSDALYYPFNAQHLRSAICLVTLTGIETEADDDDSGYDLVYPTVRIDRIEMKNDAFDCREGDEITVKFTGAGETNHCMICNSGDDSKIYYIYDCYTVPMGEFGKQYYVRLTRSEFNSEFDDGKYALRPLSAPLPDPDLYSTTQEQEAYFDSAYKQYFGKKALDFDDYLYGNANFSDFDDYLAENANLSETEDYNGFAGVKVSRTVLKLFYNSELHASELDDRYSEAAEYYQQEEITPRMIFEYIARKYDGYSQYFVQHDA